MARAGDLINQLPCVQRLAEQQGSPVAVMVLPEFASILEGVSYAYPVIFEGSLMDVAGAIAQAEKSFKRVLVGRICERGNNQCESFSQESWRQLGFLDQYETLPLVFDKRSPERESELLHQFTNGKPFALYNVGGKSSPVPNGQQWIERNKNRICPGVRWVDLQRVMAHRIYDLLGLMDRAKVLVTGDTSSIHISAASKVPVVNLIQEFPSKWHGSKPRNNSIACWRYSEIPHEVPLSAIQF